MTTRYFCAQTTKHGLLAYSSTADEGKDLLIQYAAQDQKHITVSAVTAD